MKKTLRYLIPVAAIVCSFAFILNYSLERKRITEIRDNLYGFSVEAARLPFSSDWKEIIEAEKYPHLDYTKLEFIPVLKESLPKGKPFIIYKDSDRTYEVWLDGHINTHKNKT